MKQEKESLLESTIRDCNCGTISVTTKVTKKCNIRPACKYCYDFDDSSSDMSIETLENLTKKSIASGDFGRVIFVWHGGEPLVMGRQFFSQALEFQKKYNPGNVKIENRIQTNAVAMGARWIEFLKENGFMMEASFDAFDNDFSRGETDKVLKNILLSKEMDYAPGNIMFIATKNNISRLRESFDYFHDLGLNFTPSPIISLGQACQNSELAITPEEYGYAICDLMDYMHTKQEVKIEVRFVDAVWKAVMFGQQDLCSHGYCVYQFVACDDKGDVYPCAKVDDPNWSFGNVNSLSKLSDIFSNPRYAKYAKQSIGRVTGCLEENDGEPCEVFQYCKGGCASNALAAGGYSKRDFYCKAYKIVFNHAVQRHKEIMSSLQKIKEDK